MQTNIFEQIPSEIFLEYVFPYIPVRHLVGSISLVYHFTRDLIECNGNWRVLGEVHFEKEKIKDKKEFVHLYIQKYRVKFQSHKGKRCFSLVKNRASIERHFGDNSPENVKNYLRENFEYAHTNLTWEWKGFIVKISGHAWQTKFLDNVMRSGVYKFEILVYSNVKNIPNIRYGLIPLDVKEKEKDLDNIFSTEDAKGVQRYYMMYTSSRTLAIANDTNLKEKQTAKFYKENYKFKSYYQFFGFVVDVDKNFFKVFRNGVLGHEFEIAPNERGYCFGFASSNSRDVYFLNNNKKSFEYTM